MGPATWIRADAALKPVKGEIVKRIDYGPIYAKAHERLLESRCLRQSVEQYTQLGGAVPLHEIQVHCKKNPSELYPPP